MDGNELDKQLLELVCDDVWVSKVCVMGARCATIPFPFEFFNQKAPISRN